LRLARLPSSDGIAVSKKFVSGKAIKKRIMNNGQRDSGHSGQNDAYTYEESVTPIVLTSPTLTGYSNQNYSQKEKYALKPTNLHTLMGYYQKACSVIDLTFPGWLRS
jgi:hypothetical protein